MNIKEELQNIIVHSPIPEYIVIKRSLAKDIINELDKKDKVIDMMAGTLLVTSSVEEFRGKPASREDVKEYFYNKAQEN